MKQKNQDDSWVFCPECQIKLKKEHIVTHMKYAHDKKIEDFDESSIKILPKKEQKQKKKMNLSFGKIAIVLVILVVIVAVVFIVLSGSPDGQNNSGNSNNSQWLGNYTPVHSVGKRTDNFWINFPIGGPSAGQSVQHLTWITEDLKEKPVIFVCHRSGCAACTPQADCVKALRETYGEDVIFYDLDNPFSGYGVATEDTLEKFNEVFYYDANGPPSYIAFTGVFTLINDTGEVKIGWQTWEGNVEESVTESWIKDAIYYNNINKSESILK
jgi:hypothetical protein